MTLSRFLFFGLWPLVLSSCAIIAGLELEERFGSEQVQDRQVDVDSVWGEHYSQQVKPILENRCVVCHGCYDAPCQLKLSSSAGIDRGASKVPVYDGMRLLEAQPTRLNVDANTTDQWREQGFYPVLNERQQTPEANQQASLLYRMLALKEQHPQPNQTLLPDTLSLGTTRKQVCTKIETFEQYANKNPLWGMPYGLPNLEKTELKTLQDWITAGAPLPASPKLPEAYTQRIEQWETFFNGPSLKQQLVNRYIYEHLFLGHLYFDDLPSTYYFELIRSYTPPGQPIKPIPTRRPYDDPGSDFHYRLKVMDSTLLAKNHMPYALGHRRLAHWNELFFQEDYTVHQLPAYTPEIASNPFKAFKELPVKSRYRFMLDESAFTIMGFIKGPVCRGQIALDVIRDRFWVFFEDPDAIDQSGSARFLAEQSQHLRLPAESGSTLRPLSNWHQYNQNQQAYLKAKYDENTKYLDEGNIDLSLEFIWDGEQSNPNSALTVARHFYSASVMQGLVGNPPQTAWLIGYPILERIHYLLVAGFDVYGNVSHQLLTRLYMDFLRMEAESNFLLLLPEKQQLSEWKDWYTDASKPLQDYMKNSQAHFPHKSSIEFHSQQPKAELYEFLKQRLGYSLALEHDITRADIPAADQAALISLTKVEGIAASLLPQVVHLTVVGENQTHLYTVLHDNAHSNITSLLRENSNRQPERDKVTVTKGLIGAYPSAFWKVRSEQLTNLVNTIRKLKSESDYQVLMDQYGVRRTDKNFWPFSDAHHQRYRLEQPIDAGLLDYNRLENR